MDKFVIDANIILDFLCPEREYHDDAVRFFRGCLTGQATALIPSSSIKDAYYIMCRWYKDEAKARQLLKEFCGYFEIVPLTSVILEKAFASDEPDLEDGIVRTFAEEAHASAIITRDEMAYQKAAMPAYSCKECLESWSDCGRN